MIESKVEFYILIGFIISGLIQLYFAIRYFWPLLKSPVDIEYTDSDQNSISVIIACKNELSNLPLLIEKILSQNYSKFEVVVIDDHSTDGTWEWLEEQNHPKMRAFCLENQLKGKKSAIKYGIEKSNNEYLVFTDADCLPLSENWLKCFNQKFKDSQIVLGISLFYEEKGWLNLVYRYANMQTALQYLSFAHKGSPYMGVGRNLGYSKAVYDDYKQLEIGAKVLSGDDDLIVNHMSDKYSTSIMLSKESQTISKAVESWSKYFHQLRRQMQAGNFYKPLDQVKLWVLGFSRLLLWWFLLYLTFNTEYHLFTLVLFLIIQQILTNILRKFSHQISGGKLWILSPLLEFFNLHWLGFVGMSTWIQKVKRWK